MKYKFKKKLTKILAISMALSMIFCNNAFATPIDLVNSTESVATDTLNKTEGTDYFDDEDTNVWEDGQITERVDVTVQRESQFEVTIPKDIVLDGETGTADYIVNAKGDIAGNQKLSVVPDAEFEMTEAGGKDSVTATVTQNDTEYTYQEMLNDGTDYPGSVKATLTAGEWEGKFAFNINFEGSENEEGNDNHKHDTDGNSSLFTLYEGMDGNLGMSLPLYNMDVGDGNYLTYLRYDTTVEEEQTVNINYDVNTTGIFVIGFDMGTPELELTSPGETSGSVEIVLTEGDNSIYVAMNGSIDDSFSTSLDSQPCCSICGHIHEYDSEITKEATKQNEAGIITYTCNCGYNYTKEYYLQLEDYTWSEIAAISESGEAANYFSVGDTKEMTLSNGETYNAEIIGFNHDYVPNENGDLTKDDEGNILNETVGITFQFQELMSTKHNMNTGSKYNEGGWEASEMRDYVNNDIYNLLPADLQTEIKDVIKVSDAGNRQISTLIPTVDKLFLLSFEEVGFTKSDASYFVAGQGTKYEKFTDNASRVKNLSGSDVDWWLRSTYTGDIFSFFNVSTEGSRDYNSAYNTYGVAPAFCI